MQPVPLDATFATCKPFVTCKPFATCCTHCALLLLLPALLALSAQKASWNPSGVEPVQWKSAGFDPDSVISGANQECALFPR